MHTFYEFFAGGGMVRAGLGETWACLFANDFDHKKANTYRQNWGTNELKVADVGSLATSDIPKGADLAWASFPCQDLSLAGGGAGLKGDRSGTFWPFWKLIGKLIEEKRAPSMIVLENVCGALTSHEGQDFSAICNSFSTAGYNVGAFVVNASLFVPQSRPRLFVIGVRKDIDFPEELVADGPVNPWHTKALVRAQNTLSKKVRDSWVWWNLPLPQTRAKSFTEMIEDEPTNPSWFSDSETQNLLAMMTPLNQDKVAKAKRLGYKIVGGVYKRTRPGSEGQKVQRAEIRFDDMSGCLRTPAGGSSRQIVVIVDGKQIKARLISKRETARLMGLPESYNLPENYNEAYHLTGDGVVVPVVRHLATHIFEPILKAAQVQASVAA